MTTETRKTLVTDSEDAVVEATQYLVEQRQAFDYRPLPGHALTELVVNASAAAVVEEIFHEHTPYGDEDDDDEGEEESDIHWTPDLYDEEDDDPDY